MKPDASVVLTTYNNPGALERVLAGLERQRRGGFELWVADDGSGIETRELVERFARSAPFPVEHVWHEDRGFRKMRILNATVPLVRSDYVVLLEGDCIPNAHYVGAHLAWRRPGRFLYGHRVFLDDQTSRAIRAEAVRSGREPGGALRNVVRGLRGRARRSYNAIRLPDALLPFARRALGGRPVMRGMNFSVWKQDLLAVNGWNEEYDGWGREDDDLVARLGFLGIRGESVRFAAILFHLEHPVRRNAEALAANDRVFQEVVRRGLAVCPVGIRDVRPLEAPTAAAEQGTAQVPQRP